MQQVYKIIILSVDLCVASMNFHTSWYIFQKLYKRFATEGHPITVHFNFSPSALIWGLVNLFTGSDNTAT
jgi:hypothetical protein